MDRETKITKWADGLLEGEALVAFEAEMAADAELRREAEGARRVGEVLRAGLEADVEPPAAEFFNAQIGKRVREADGVAASGASPERASGDGNVVPLSGRVPWLVAAAACVVAVFTVFNQPERPAGDAVAGVYVPIPDVSANVYVDDEAEATVIMLEGLDEVPAERDVKPFSVASYERDGDGKAVLYAANEPGRAVYVMHLLGNGAPVIHELQ